MIYFKQFSRNKSRSLIILKYVYTYNSIYIKKSAKKLALRDKTIYFIRKLTLEEFRITSPMHCWP